MMSGNSSVMQWRQGAQRVATLPHPLAGLVALLLCSGVLVAGNDPCVCLRQHVGHLQRPLFLAHVVDTGNIDRFFVLENSGKILEFPSQNGDVPYLDISHRIAKPTPSEIGIGLLGLSLHPNFAHNWKIYVFYTTRTSGQLYGVVSQFQAKTKYQSDPDSEKVLLKIPFSTGQDIGGHLFFGDDGYLYISVGHGGQEQQEFAQNKLSLLGKILRINVDVASDGKNYSIPVDNPIVESGGQGRKEIYAYGVRSMWRCSLDSGDVTTGQGRGRIFCGDVGAVRYEEVNIIQKGGNYGWNEREGYECRMKGACHDMEMEVLPISVYEHTHVRAAVVGGYMYRGKDIPSIHGHYIFGDASSGEMFRLVEPENIHSKWISHLLTVCDKSLCPCDAPEEQPKHIVSFSTDRKEELYVLTTNSLVAEWATGAIYKLVAPVGNRNDKVTCAGGTIRWSVVAVLVWILASVTLT